MKNPCPSCEKQKLTQYTAKENKLVFFNNAYKNMNNLKFPDYIHFILSL
jgi:hypothetical protein